MNKIWDENNPNDAPPINRPGKTTKAREKIDLDELDDGRCKFSSWRGPRSRGTYENYFGPGGFNRCIGKESHANPLHKDEWGNVFCSEPFRVIRREDPVVPT